MALIDYNYQSPFFGFLVLLELLFFAFYGDYNKKNLKTKTK